MAVDESRALIKLKMDVEMQWNDTRISADNPECTGAVADSEWDKIYRYGLCGWGEQDCTRTLHFKSATLSSLVQTNFRPDPFIYNTEKTHVVEMVGGRAEDIWLGPEGFEWWMEWEVTVQCPFNFAWFPFDTQVRPRPKAR